MRRRAWSPRTSQPDSLHLTRRFHEGRRELVQSELLRNPRLHLHFDFLKIENSAWITSPPTLFLAILLTLALFGANAAESSNEPESRTEQLAKETQNPVANLISVPLQNNFNLLV